MREFNTGATRDSEDGKLDYEGFLSPRVLRRYAEYMHSKRETPDGRRDSDNWQKGIPEEVYLKSLIRHTMQLWEAERTGVVPEEGLGIEEGYICVAEYIEETLCAIIFNAMGLLYEKDIHAQNIRLDGGTRKDYDNAVIGAFLDAARTAVDCDSMGGCCDPALDRHFDEDEDSDSSVENEQPHRVIEPAPESALEEIRREASAVLRDYYDAVGRCDIEDSFGQCYDEDVFYSDPRDGEGWDAED